MSWLTTTILALLAHVGSFGQVTGYIATALCLATASSGVEFTLLGSLNDAGFAIILS